MRMIQYNLSLTIIRYSPAHRIQIQNQLNRETNEEGSHSRFRRGLSMEGSSKQQSAVTNKKKTKTMAADSNPDQKTLRCHHCAGPLSMKTETSDWTVAPFIRDSFSMIGTAVGGTTSAFYGFNHVMPIVRRWVKGPMWLHFLVGAPPVIVFSSACAGLTGGAVPAIAQLASSSYHAAVSSRSLPSPPSQDDTMRKSKTSSTL